MINYTAVYMHVTLVVWKDIRVIMDIIALETDTKSGR